MKLRLIAEKQGLSESRWSDVSIKTGLKSTFGKPIKRNIARKPKKCVLCGGNIMPGELYADKSIYSPNRFSHDNPYAELVDISVPSGGRYWHPECLEKYDPPLTDEQKAKLKAEEERTTAARKRETEEWEARQQAMRTIERKHSVGSFSSSSKSKHMPTGRQGTSLKGGRPNNVQRNRRLD